MQIAKNKHDVTEIIYHIDVSSNVLNNRINNFELRQAFTHFCELPDVWRKCFHANCYCLYCGRVNHI